MLDAAGLVRVLEEFVEVQPDEQFLKLAFLGEVAYDLVHEARVVSERVRNVLQIKLGLFFAAYVDTVAAHEEVQFKHELENLIQRNLQPVVASSCQETFLQDFVQVGIVKRDQLLEVVHVGQLAL